MQLYFIYLWQGMGGILVTMFSTVVFAWFAGLCLLLAINAYRWLALRVKREIEKPHKAVLKPSILWKVFDRGMTRQPKMPAVKAVKNGKGVK